MIYGKDILGPYCNFHTVFARWLLYFQAALLVIIGIDRAYLSVKPLRYSKYGSHRSTIGLLFLGAVTGLISLPKLALQQFVFIPTLGQCILFGYNDPKSALSMLLNVSDKVVGLGGILGLIACNCVLIATNKGRDKKTNGRLARKPTQKLTVIAVTVILVFVVSVLPYLAVKLVFNIKPSLVYPPFLPWVRRAIVGSYFMMHISSSINPVLYVLQGLESKRVTGVQLRPFRISNFSLSLKTLSLNRKVRGLGAGPGTYKSSPRIKSMSSFSDIQTNINNCPTPEIEGRGSKDPLFSALRRDTGISMKGLGGY
ncbi:hypothetical protein ACHWQZ_G004581 [Mnemiopsis leidyi]